MPQGRGISENELLIPYKSPPFPVRGVVGTDIDKCITVALMGNMDQLMSRENKAGHACPATGSMCLCSRMSLIRTRRLTEATPIIMTGTPTKCYCHAHFAVHMVDLGYANKASNRKKLISPASI